MNLIYFDIMCGAAGDMILSSLIDAGVPLPYLLEQFSKLDIEGLSIEENKTTKSGITGVSLDISWTEQKSYRHIHNILDLIKSGGFSDNIIENSKKVLYKIANAEAKVHGIPVEKVHFHEIGAVDTIVDVLGVCLALDYLKVKKIYFSIFTIGYGTISCEHGMMPVPAPATAEMLKGYSSLTLDIDTEILTPTGCAILTALGEQVSKMPTSKIIETGYGAGTKDFNEYPNLIRATILESNESQNYSSDTVAILESDIDHVSGEILAFTADKLFEAGILDVSWTSVFMKKGRPAYRLTAICKPDDIEKYVDIIIFNTRTLGVRYHIANRITAQRFIGDFELLGENIVTKKCNFKDIEFTKAEYESLVKIANSKGIPLIDLMDRFNNSFL